MFFIEKLNKSRKLFLKKYYQILFALFEKPLFKRVGKKFSIGKDFTFINQKFICIGDYFSADSRVRIEAIGKYGSQVFTPQIIIGNHVSFNTDIHIGCIDKIIIGDNVLLASRIFISDHSHGETTLKSLDLPPKSRPLYSKGPVIIEENVWIGEGVSILSNVKIGKNSIVGANSVVTRSFDENSIIAGVPARLIGKIQ